MPRVTDFQVLKWVEHPVLSIRLQTSVPELPKVIGQSFQKLGTYAEEAGEVPTDLPFVAYHNVSELNEDNVTVEFGFPVSKVLPEKDGMKTIIQPETLIVFCMYRGEYGKMESVYNEMMEWINTHGYKAKDVSYEYYYNGPEFPEEEMLTRVLFPVEKV